MKAGLCAAAIALALTPVCAASAQTLRPSEQGDHGAADKLKAASVGRAVLRTLSDGRMVIANEAYSDAELNRLYGLAPPPRAPGTRSNFGDDLQRGVGQPVFRRLSDGRLVYADPAYTDDELNSMYGAAPPQRPSGQAQSSTIQGAKPSDAGPKSALLSAIASGSIPLAAFLGLLFFVRRRRAGPPSRPWMAAILWGGIPIFLMASPAVLNSVFMGLPIFPAVGKAVGGLLLAPIVASGAYLVTMLLNRRRANREAGSSAAETVQAPFAATAEGAQDVTPDPFTVAGQEILSGNLEPGAWARSLLEANGDELKAKGRYVELRVAQLKG